MPDCREFFGREIPVSGPSSSVGAPRTPEKSRQHSQDGRPDAASAVPRAAVSSPRTAKKKKRSSTTMIKGEKSPQNASDTTSATSSGGGTPARATTSGTAPPSLSDGLGVGKARVLEYLERTKAWLETPLCQFRVGQSVLYHSNAHPDDLRTGVIVDLRPDLHSRRIDLDSRKGVKRKKCRPTLQDLHRMQAGLQPILEMEKVAQAVAAERSTISQEMRTAALHVKLSEKDESLLRRLIDDELTVGLGARLKAEGAID